MPYLPNSTFTGNTFFKQQHLETIIPALFRKVYVEYKRKTLELNDGDFLDLDWLTQPSSKLLVLLHGLEGSSDSQYIKGFAKNFYEQGWNICAMNFRSCSGRMNRLARSYHSGATEDLDAVLTSIIQQHPFDSIILGGFSLGGNLLLKYLGEQKYLIPTQVKGAFAFSVPCDLRASAIEMAKWQNTVYMKRFLRSLHHKMKLKSAQFEQFPNTQNLHQIKTFHQFDDRFNAPVHGFKSADDYYAQCNSLQYLQGISLPTLLVNALNDPFLTPSCFPYSIAAGNEFLILETPQYGGHVGFAEHAPNGKYWSEHRAGQFISSLGL